MQGAKDKNKTFGKVGIKVKTQIFKNTGIK